MKQPRTCKESIDMLQGGTIDRARIDALAQLTADLHAARRLMADLCDDVEIEEGDLAVIAFDWIRKLREEANKDPAISGEWEDRVDEMFEEPREEAKG